MKDKWKLSCSLIVIVSAASSIQAQATNLGAPALAAAPAVSRCRVVDVLPAKAPLGGAGMLFAVCGSHGAPLGPADSYRASVNPVFGSVLVVVSLAGRTRVMLASLVATGGGVHLDDVTREVARLGGRSGDLGLDDLTVDTTRFAVDGSIAVTNKRGEVKALDLTTYATRAARARAAITQ